MKIGDAVFYVQKVTVHPSHNWNEPQTEYHVREARLVSFDARFADDASEEIAIANDAGRVVFIKRRTAYPTLAEAEAQKCALEGF
jgi:hypothetical protein